MPSIRIFQDAQAIESLRNSDFDAHSAYGEVIDNSIQADAKNIRIQFNYETTNNSFTAIRTVAFGDDGSGMNYDTIHRCLQLGWSSRYNNRDGIGRFGVGMTMAAIHECMCVEVWSKVEGDKKWRKIKMDLEKLGNGSDAELTEPTEEKSLPTEYTGLIANKDHGTLVVWSKYDRWHGNKRELDELIDEFKIYCGRTYRYYLWNNGVSISINGENVTVIDPLYANLVNTKFPNDPKAEVYPDITLPWPKDDGSGTDNILIRISLLPEEFRREKGMGGNKEARMRYIDRNEGISILRNKREVLYDIPPFWGGVGRGWQFEELDRWWGCEIHFPATLDRAFTVKNIKRGALPVPQLREKLKELITPTRKTIRDR